MPRYTLDIDGAPRAVEAQPDEPLLYVLTDKLKLKGPRAEPDLPPLPCRCIGDTG